MADARSSSTQSNTADALVERHRIGGRGSELAVIDDAGAWTFAELSEACGRAAAGLSLLGVRPGDRVAVALPDGREAAAALIGAMRIGAIAVPVDPAGSASVTAAVIADCGPRVVVDRPGMLDGGTPHPVAPVRPTDRP